MVARGATPLSSLADAAREDVVFSMVLDDAALDSLHDAETGLFSETEGRRVRIWIDGSTVSPAAAERAAEAARVAGVAYVSAPVSGNPGVVTAGNAIFAVSGNTDALEVAEEICAEIGRSVHRVGTGSEANVVKLCTNALLAVTMQTLAEVNVLADKSGVRRSALMAFVNDSAIGSPFSRYKSVSLVGLDMTPTFTPEGQRKDIRLALDLAARTDTPMPLISATEVAYSRLVSGGLGEGRDFAALLLQVARDAGIDLEPEDEGDQT